MTPPDSSLPSGSLAPARCTHSTLFVLLGDSIDREVVRSRCARPVLYNPQHCAKCALCNAEQQGCDSHLNVMLFGLGLFGCEHDDRHWAPHEETQSPQPRIRALLGGILQEPAAATFASIVISMHSGDWDVLATKECANISTVLLDTPAAWFEAADRLVDTTNAVVAASPVARRVRMPLLWRTAPLLCRSFAAGEDATELVAAVSSHGATLACRHGLTLVDWRGLSCRRLNSSLLLSDGTHWQPAAYDLMADELTRRATSEHGGGANACHVGTSRCECALCHTFVPWSWKLGRQGAVSCSHQRDHSTTVDVGSDALEAKPREAAPAESATATTVPSEAAILPACLSGSRPSRPPASVALFGLAAYPSLSTPSWIAMSTLGWQANADFLHMHVLAEVDVPAEWAPPGSNVIPLVFRAPLVDSLLRFAGVSSPTNRSRAASFAPLLADFAERACALDLSGYAFFGSVELDVVLGALPPFLAPYMQAPPAPQFDAIALRWAPPNKKAWTSVDDAVVYNTLADTDAGVPFSTPLLLLRNNATMRQLWWQAEQWLRTQERPGAYSLRHSATCRTCTSPLYWFDEHNWPNYWRHAFRGPAAGGRPSGEPSSTSGGAGPSGAGLSGTSVRVAFVCCAFDDHHVGVGSSVRAIADGCTVEWSGGVLTRTCSSAAKYAWDGGLSHPPPAVGSNLHGCDEHDVSEWPARANWSLGSPGCARLPRHAASEEESTACVAPAASFGYDICWLGAARETTASAATPAHTVAVLGGGDSAAALLTATDGRCYGVAVKRTLAAFHAARSKHLRQGELPRANETVELFPRFL